VTVCCTQSSDERAARAGIDMEACVTEPLPLRLHRAASILSRTGDPGAADAQSACGEVAARIVMLEEALIAMLSGAKGAADQARRVLAGG